MFKRLLLILSFILFAIAVIIDVIFFFIEYIFCGKVRYLSRIIEHWINILLQEIYPDGIDEFDLF